jgi:Fic family protein
MDKLMDMLNTSTIHITPSLLAFLSRIDQFKGSWQALGTLAPERLRALRRVATIESIASSTRIEGSKLSNDEVRALLGGLKIKQFTTRDEQEVAGYAEVMETIFSAWEHVTLTENHIKQLHRDLLIHGVKDEHHRGKYKTLENSVAAFDRDGKQVATIFQTASAFDTPRLMAELVEWTNDMRKSEALHPLLVIAVFVVVFLEIHPFQDGNGRLSRVLTTLLMLQAGYAYVPYSSLESIIEQNKEGYYLALPLTQKTIRSKKPNWQPWLEFFLSSLASQVKRLEEKIEQERATLATIADLPSELLSLTAEHGRLTVALAERFTGAKRPTIKYHIAKLVSRGELVQHGVGKGTWYSRAN